MKSIKSGKIKNKGQNHRTVCVLYIFNHNKEFGRASTY